MPQCMKMMWKMSPSDPHACFSDLVECAWDTRVSETFGFLHILSYGLALSWLMHHNCMLGLDCEQVLDVKKP